MITRRQLIIAASFGALLGTSSASAQSGPVTVAEVQRLFESRDIGARKMVQSALQRAGYYRGSIDGLWGPSTAAAYRQLMASDRYQRHASRWTWARDVQVSETMFFLNSDAYE